MTTKTLNETETQIIARAAFDLLDTMGAITKPREINENLGLSADDLENLRNAREILIEKGFGN